MSFFKARADKDKSKAVPAKVPWTEKYRPKTLGDVAAQDAIVSVLNKSVHSANLPHMLFYGPPGTGKTSTVVALAKDLYGPELYRTRVLELNASDDRGIAVVRDKIKNFSRTVVPPASAAAKARYPAPDYKLVVLDEADMMTQDAQSALRRTMETYSKLTRFVLICNYVTRIIDPLASRCSKFRFKELSTDSALDRLRFICREEGVTADPAEGEDAVLFTLLRVANGDLRRAITLLQSAAGLAGPTGVSSALVSELSGAVPDSDVARLLAATKTGNQRRVESAVAELVLEGYSVAQLLDQLHDAVMHDLAVSSKAKTKVALSLSEADRRLADGADEHIELLNVSSQMALALKA